MYLISKLNRGKLLKRKIRSFRNNLGVIFDFNFQFSISIFKINFQCHFKKDLPEYKLIKVPNEFKLMFRSKCLGLVETSLGASLLSSNNYGEIIDKLQSRKSQAGTKVQISDLEFSLKTHFSTTHPPGKVFVRISEDRSLNKSCLSKAKGI